MNKIDYNDFEKVELRVGTITAVDDFPEARIPAYKLTIDLGENIGVRRSSSQITDYYKKDDLIGKQVIAVVNFEPKQVGKFMSEVLVTGFYDEVGKVVLISPDQVVPNGSKLL